MLDELRGMLDDLNEVTIPERHLDFLDDMLRASEDPFWNPSPKQQQYITNLHTQYVRGE
jgi:hypothetical protein